MSLTSGLTLGFFNLGGGEVLVILLVALLVLGPDKLPEASRQIGKTIATFREMAQGFQKELESVRDEITEAEARVRGELSAADRPHPRPVQDAVQPHRAASAPPAESTTTAESTATTDAAEGWSNGETNNIADTAESSQTAEAPAPETASVPFASDAEPDRTDKPQSAPMANGVVPSDPFAGTTPASVERRPPVAAPVEPTVTDDGGDGTDGTDGTARPTAPNQGSEL